MAARHAGAKFGLHVYALKMAERSNDENYSQTLRTQPKFTVLNKTKWYEVVHCQLVLQIKCIVVFSSFWSFSLFKVKVETQISKFFLFIFKSQSLLDFRGWEV